MRGQGGHGTRGGAARARAWALVALALLLAAAPGSAGGSARDSVTPIYTTSDEYKLKAAYLFNFAKYVEWPAARLPAPDSPIVIGVLGADPFGDRLDRTVRGRTIGRHPVVVRRGRHLEDLAGCHMLFVGRGESARARQIAEMLRESPVLTVGEASDFVATGGMIWLGRAGDAVEFDVNLDAVRQAGLAIGARMLASARDVVGSHDGREH